MCPCRDLLDLLANKWSALAFGALEDGLVRFGELKRTREGVSPKVLSRTLKRLEDHELIIRTVYAEVPPRVEHALTERGHGAAVPLVGLREWVESTLQT
jgi:DNA-binding HxlR family transcriptional regulator